MNDWRKVFAQIPTEKLLPPKHFTTFLIHTVPHERINLTLASLALHNKPDAPGGALRRMRDTGWQTEGVAGPERDVVEGAAIDDAQCHLALQLVEPLLTSLNMVIHARVRPCDKHDLELARVEQVVAHGRLEKMPVLREPLGNIEGG